MGFIIHSSAAIRGTVTRSARARTHKAGSVSWLAECPLRSENYRIAALPRSDAMGQEETHALQEKWGILRGNFR
jgi:hypothetical protein